MVMLWNALRFWAYCGLGAIIKVELYDAIVVVRHKSIVWPGMYLDNIQNVNHVFLSLHS